MQFWIILPKLGCHGNFHWLLEIIQIAHLNSRTPITLFFAKKILQIVYRTEISASFAYFCPNLVAMATPVAPLKIAIEYLNSRTPRALPYAQKLSRYLVQNWNKCNFRLSLPKFGCHGNSLCSLENSDIIFEFADTDNPILQAKSVSISCRELK